MTQEKNRLHANEQSEELSDFVKQDIRELVELLEGRIDRLRKQALLVIEQSPELAKAFGHLTSIKGIADAAGIQLLAELGSLAPGHDDPAVGRACRPRPATAPVRDLGAQAGTHQQDRERAPAPCALSNGDYLVLNNGGGASGPGPDSVIRINAIDLTQETVTSSGTEDWGALAIVPSLFKPHRLRHLRQLRLPHQRLRLLQRAAGRSAPRRRAAGVWSQRAF